MVGALQNSLSLIMGETMSQETTDPLTSHWRSLSVEEQRSLIYRYLSQHDQSERPTWIVFLEQTLMAGAISRDKTIDCKPI